MSTAPPLQPLERRIYIQAQAFHMVAKQNLRMGTPTGPNTALPGLVCNIFASELYLKCIILLESGQNVRGHDLNKLFKLLKPDTRREIEIRFDAIEERTGANVAQRFYEMTGKYAPSKFKDILVECAGAFVEWRYLYEDAERPKHFGLIPLPDLLRDFIITTYPEYRTAGYVLKEVIPNTPTSPVR